MDMFMSISFSRIPIYCGSDDAELSISQFSLEAIAKFISALASLGLVIRFDGTQ